MSAKFGRIENVYRDTLFVLEEVDAETYDDIVDKAKIEYEDPVTGETQDRIDEQTVIKLLLKESLVEPEGFNLKKCGQRLKRQLERDVRELHFGVEPKTGSAAGKRADEDDDDPNQAGA